MVGNEGGGDNPPLKRPRAEGDGVVVEDSSGGGGGERIDSNSMYKPYFKPNYKRLYPENSSKTDFKVFVENLDHKDKLGNKSPMYLNHIFTNEVKGVMAIQRLNANKIAVLFKQYNTANNFLNNTTFLEKYNMKAYIPATQIERTGVIRFVPTNISNEELYTKLTSIYEIIAIRRFTKKVGQERVPLQTVSITFLSNELPDNVQYDLFSYRIFDYIPPLQQCFKCFKFNHSAKICNGKQRCSICSGQHLFKECDKPNEICCANCSGPHLAISKICPIKIKKITEKKGKISYSSVTQSVKKSELDFPPLPLPRTNTERIVNKTVNKPVNKLVNNSVNSKPVSQAPRKDVRPTDIKAQIISNNDVLMVLVQTLVELGNSGDSTPITATSIKDMLIKNLSP